MNKVAWKIEKGPNHTGEFPGRLFLFFCADDNSYDTPVCYIHACGIVFTKKYHNVPIDKIKELISRYQAEQLLDI